MTKVIESDELRSWVDENEYEEASLPPVPDKFSLAWPAPSPKVVTQEWGKNAQWYKPFGLPGHEGLDFRAPNDVPIYAAATGEVIRVETDPGAGPYGIHVRIQHNHPEATLKSIYAHFRRAAVAVGDQVIAGQQIGLADNTGNSSGAHLHLTLKRVDQGSPWMNTGDIVNPTPYLPDLFPGDGWRVDVGGNFRTSPEVADNLIRYIPAGSIVKAVDFDREAGGDWWKIIFEGIVGWCWVPYKLSII